MGLLTTDYEDEKCGLLPEKQIQINELANGINEFDLIALGRSLIGDCHGVNKYKQQQFDQIRPYTKADLKTLL